MDVADSAPEFVKAEGLDINIKDVPPKAWLPDNVSFREFDLLKDIPDELIDRYDIIHVQFAASFVRDQYIAEAMKKLVSMLS